MTDLPGKGQQPDARPGRRRAATRLVTVVGVVALVGAAAVAASTPLGSTSGPQVPPGASYPTIAGIAGPGIGQPAPDFLRGDGRTSILSGLDGQPIRIRDFAGRPLWIVFWATWCTPCQQEAVAIRAAYHAHRDADLAILAVDIQEPAEAVRAFVLANNLDYVIGLDPTAGVMALYGARGLPAHVFVNARGLVWDRYAGQMTAELMEQHLAGILGR
jgi:cytochrome c biogenesis protein CcmG/thiol:disulfide interchange protein DsbE